MQLEYQFVENPYPAHDPNTDIDFDSNITYNYLTGKSKLLNNLTIENVPYTDESRNDDEVQRTKHFGMNNNKTDYKIICIIFFLILAVACLWYMFRRDNVHQTKQIFTSNFTDDIELFSPYFWKNEI